MRKIVLLPIILVISFSLVWCSAACAASDHEGRAKIGLQPDGDASYTSDSSDPWFTDSWISDATDFNLDVTSFTKASSIYLANLVIAIPQNTEDTGWSFNLGNSTFNYASFDQSGAHPYLPPHGVFSKDDGALWTEYSLGPIGAGDTISVPFSGTDLPHGMLVHFDAYGSSLNGEQNGWYRNSCSHDVTVTPEPISAALFLTGGLVLAARRMARRKTK